MRQPKSGYVLLVVIAVCVLVITALSSLAKISLRESLAAAEAHRGLQMRWGARSIDLALVNQMPRLFDEAERLAMTADRPTRPPKSIRAAITLGGVTFDLLMGDEDAKVDINTIYHRDGLSAVEQTINQFAGPVAPGVIRLVPAMAPLETGPRLSELTTDQSDAPEDGDADADTEFRLAPAFRSWGEVFDLDALWRATGNDASIATATSEITLFSSGRLNVRRASDDSVIVVLGSVVQDGAPRRIVGRLADDPALALSTVISTEIREPQDRRDLADRLSETSQSFSLWIDASARNGQMMRTLTVTRLDQESVTGQIKFAF